jgi:hypothetical protein
LTLDQWLDLTLGPPPVIPPGHRPAFASPADRLAAWRFHRDDLMAVRGPVPAAYWEFDAPPDLADLPDHHVVYDDPSDRADKHRRQAALEGARAAYLGRGLHQAAPGSAAARTGRPSDHTTTPTAPALGRPRRASEG